MGMIGNAIAVHDKLCKIDWTDNEQALRDFQLIDYTLLCGAIGYDAAAGLSNLKTMRKGGALL